MKHILLFLFLSIPCFSQYNWESAKGTVSGSPMGVLIEDNKKNYYFCNGAGPFYSNDQGHNWIWCEGGYNKLVKSLLVDKSDNLYYFLDSVFISSNKGKTFKSYKNFDSQVEGTISRFTYPNCYNDTVACISNQYKNDSGFFAINYSVDKGVTFKKTITDSSIINIRIIDNLIHDSLGHYYFTLGSDGLYMINSIKSTDKKLIYKYPFEYSDGSEMLRIMHDTVLIYQFGRVPNYTTDYGETWNNFKNQPTYFINCATNKNTYIGVDEENLWKTTNFGETWELIYNYGGYLTAPPIPFITSDGICFLSFGYNDSGRDLLRGEQTTGIIRNNKDEYLLKLLNKTNTIELKETADFHLFDITGQHLIYEREVVMIDISNLISGTYFYKLIIDKKEYNGKLFIKR